MNVEISKDLLAAYSRAEITRKEIEERIGAPVSFGALLGQLHRSGLPFPRIKSDPQSPGIQLIQRLAEGAS